MARNKDSWLISSPASLGSLTVRDRLLVGIGTTCSLRRVAGSEVSWLISSPSSASSEGDITIRKHLISVEHTLGAIATTAVVSALHVLAVCLVNDHGGPFRGGAGLLCHRSEVIMEEIPSIMIMPMKGLSCALLRGHTNRPAVIGEAAMSAVSSFGVLFGHADADNVCEGFRVENVVEARFVLPL